MPSLRRILEIAHRKMVGPRRHYLSLFRRIHGRPPIIDPPAEPFDKIAYLVLRSDLSSINHLADKHLVRDHVRARVGESHLAPLVGVYDRFDQIDRASLPKSFVIKCTHGCRWNQRVEDRDAIDWRRLGRRMERWRRRDYSKVWGESLYRGLIGRLMVEPWLGGPDGDLHDIKIFVDRGRAIGGIIHSADEPKRCTGYDAEGEVVQTCGDGVDPPVHSAFHRCMELATVLGRELPSVRVDMLATGDRIHVGELTFLTGAGLHPRFPGPEFAGDFDPREFDRRPILQAP
ncbi:MAG: hypothetical protein GY895_08030 [Phycisphaera sp.]|nr:hypothetical protein [Phycisphaera sp.]